MRFLELNLDKNLRETISRGTPMFPCSYYDAGTNLYMGNEVPWHWHEELELSIVVEGAAMVNCGESSFVTMPGQGFFINSNVLHSLHPLGGGNCRCKTLVFHHSLLSGAPESIFEQKYIRPILNSSKLEALCLSPELDWQQEAIGCILSAYDALVKGAFGYELQVRDQLSHLWYLLTLHTKTIITSGKSISSIDAERLKRMLEFIQQNYSDPITVTQIAAAAGISQSECYRCFKRIMGQPPVARVTRYRIHRAVNLLEDSNLSVTEICYAVGFNSPSYFTKVFTERLHCTPREYRNRDSAARAKKKKSTR